MNRALVVFLLTLGGASAWAALRPGPSVQPGELLPGHAALRNDCAACHALGRGVESERCRTCHPLESIGQKRKELATLHAPLAQIECFACHAEHAGRLGRAPAARFRHERIEGSLREDCQRCHAAMRPADARHAGAVEHCAACHSTSGWKPAGFDHALVAAGTSCASCHAARAPTDELHAASPDCSACHSTNSWKSANYDHSRWFRFDEHHPARCGDCHEPGRGFKTYTCATCHSASQIAHEHDEVGARDLKNCVECHRSGNKHDAEHGGERAREEHQDDEH